MSHITCHVSPVTCHLSHVNKKIYILFLSFKKIDKVVEIVGGGSVINGAYPVSFDSILPVERTTQRKWFQNLILNSKVRANDCEKGIAISNVESVWRISKHVGKLVKHYKLRWIHQRQCRDPPSTDIPPAKKRACILSSVLTRHIRKFSLCSQFVIGLGKGGEPT